MPLNKSINLESRGACDTTGKAGTVRTSHAIPLFEFTLEQAATHWYASVEKCHIKEVPEINPYSQLLENSIRSGQLKLSNAETLTRLDLMEFCLSADIPFPPFIQILPDQVDKVTGENNDVGTVKEAESENVQTSASAAAQLPSDNHQEVQANSPTKIPATSNDFLFSKEGDVWALSFDGRDIFRVKNLVGMGLIAFLLRNPKERFHAVDLETAVRGNPSTDSRAGEFCGQTVEQLESKGMRTVKGHGNLGEKATKKSIKEAEETKKLLEDELAAIPPGTNPDREKELDSQINQFQKHLNEVSWGNGRPKIEHGENERVRQRVGNAIRTAIKNIRKHNPQLADYFKENIKTGHYLEYRPKAPILWTFK